MNNNISWILELSVKSGEMDNVKMLMAEMVQATEANEPGAMNYEWFLNEAESSIHLYERYADSEAALVHLGNFGAKFAERFLASMTPTGLNVYGNPNEELTKALTGFGGVFFPPIGGFARY